MQNYVVRLVAAVAVALLSSAPVAAQDDDTVGSVMDANGPWQVASGAVLATGSRVPAGSKIVLEPGAKPDPLAPWYIHVALDDSDAADCNDASTCALPLVMPSDTAARGDSTIAGILQKFAKNATIFIGARVRDVHAGPRLQDAVVPLSLESAGLRPIFAGPVPDQGSFEARLRDIDPSHAEPPADLDFTLRWSGGSAPALPAGVGGGLYELTVFEADGASAIESIWIAVVDPAQYDASSKAFGRVIAQARVLQAKSGLEVARRYERAGLAYLSSP
jgi:hypothetical protein